MIVKSILWNELYIAFYPYRTVYLHKWEVTLQDFLKIPVDSDILMTQVAVIMWP